MDLPPAHIATAVQQSDVGLTFTRELSEDEWVHMGQALARQYTRSQWQIGDWARYGTFRYGDKYEPLIGASGLAYETVKNMKSVAVAFDESSRRRDNLSWSHHQAVASLPRDEADAWLELASTQKLSVMQLRAALAQLGRRGLPPTEPMEFDKLSLVFERRRVQAWREVAEREGCPDVKEWLALLADRAVTETLAAI